MKPKHSLPDTIQLAHGSGGQMTRELLDQIVFNTFRNPYLEQKHDGAIVPLKGPVVISTPRASASRAMARKSMFS